jgi:hypothetical protein
MKKCEKRREKKRREEKRERDCVMKRERQTEICNRERSYREITERLYKEREQ